MQTRELINVILDDLSNTLHQVESGQIDKLWTVLLNSERIFVAGKGRTGLQLRAFAMRLMHLGLEVYVVDDVTTPSIQPGDFLIIGSGSGRTSSVIRLAERAQSTGAVIGVIVGSQASPIVAFADHVVTIPISKYEPGGPSADKSVLVMGSLFEHTIGLLCELIIVQLKATLNVSEDEMVARHANLE